MSFFLPRVLRFIESGRASATAAVQKLAISMEIVSTYAQKGGIYSAGQ